MRFVAHAFLMATDPAHSRQPRSWLATILYLSTTYTHLAAPDAETSSELRTLDPKACEGGPQGVGPRGFKDRCISYWSDGYDDRVFLNSRDRLTQLIPRAAGWRRALARAGASC